MNLDALPPALLVLLPLAVLAETVWARRSRRAVYTPAETLSTIGVALLNRLGGVLTLALKYAIFAGVAALAPWSLPVNALTIVTGFLLTEIAYYWYHRLSHEWAPLWAIHHVHHSSTEYNLTTAARLNLMGGVVGAVWFAPLALLGLDPAIIVVSLAAGLFYQFFLHTQAVPALGPVEGWINTPSAHRVHHGSNPVYLDRNYAASLLVLDRVFGSYQPEVEPVRYGVTTGHYSNNPLTLVFGPLATLLRLGRQPRRT